MRRPRAVATAHLPSFLRFFLSPLSKCFSGGFWSFDSLSRNYYYGTLGLGTDAQRLHARTVYFRGQLIALRAAGVSARTPELPDEIRRKTYRRCKGGQKKQGRKRWVETTEGIEAVSPLCHLTSLARGAVELRISSGGQRENRKYSLRRLGRPNISIRDRTENGKREGGGLVVLDNNRYCDPGHINIKERTRCLDVELLTVGIRP